MRYKLFNKFDESLVGVLLQQVVQLVERVLVQLLLHFLDLGHEPHLATRFLRSTNQLNLTYHDFVLGKVDLLEVPYRRRCLLLLLLVFIRLQARLHRLSVVGLGVLVMRDDMVDVLQHVVDLRVEGVGL